MPLNFERPEVNLLRPTPVEAPGELGRKSAFGSAAIPQFQDLVELPETYNLGRDHRVLDLGPSPRILQLRDRIIELKNQLGDIPE